MLYLRSQNSNLKHCVTIISKTERDLVAKRAGRRKMRSLAYRICEKRKKKGQSDDSSTNESDQLQHNTPK